MIVHFSPQSIFVSYGIVTFNNNNTLSNDQIECSTIDRRLNSDLSLISTSHQQQPSNIHSFDNILSSSSSSHIFRASSLSTNNIGDNTSGHIIFFDENFQDQTTNYLLGPPSSTTLTDDTNQTNLPKSISRSYLSHINEEKFPSSDPYALTEPITCEKSSVSSPPNILTKPSLSSDTTINYTDLVLPSNTGDEQQEYYSSDNNDLIEEKNERSSTILYTDIDFHQTQRRDRIAQFAAISKNNEQVPPFVL